MGAIPQHRWPLFSCWDVTVPQLLLLLLLSLLSLLSLLEETSHVIYDAHSTPVMS